MNEPLAILIASIEASIAWAGATAFITIYALKAQWRSSFSGRSMMYLVMSLWLLLTLALTGRWIEPEPVVYQITALTVYGILVLTILRLLLLLILVLWGKITPESPNPKLVREWVARRRDRLRVKS